MRLGQRLRLGQAAEWSLLGEFAEQSRTWRAGYAYRLGGTFDLGVEGSRREAANDDAPEHAIELRLRASW